MAYGVILEFSSNVGKAQYDAANEKLSIDMATGAGDWPKGLVHHAAGTTPDGFCVYEVWESKAAQEDFMATRLGPVLAAVGVPAPTRVTEVDVIAHQPV